MQALPPSLVDVQRLCARRGGASHVHLTARRPQVILRRHRTTARRAARSLVVSGAALWLAAGRRSGLRVRCKQPQRGRVAIAAASVAAEAASEYQGPVLLLGGSGRIGTAAAIHLLQKQPQVSIVLAGRDEQRGMAAVAEVCDAAGEAAIEAKESVSFLKVDWTNPSALGTALSSLRPQAVLHTAGPFDDDASAKVLRTVIEAAVPVYVDVADPMDYIRAAQALSPLAHSNGTMAVVTAGAFPGLSNVLAVECARRLGDDAPLLDIDFAYFTCGLGGSGAVNLLITNLGFGNPLPVFRDGLYTPQMEAGQGLREVEFFLGQDDPTKGIVGKQDVWLWPFPEAGTVAEYLGIQGKSNSSMGTAPGFWNTILVGLVSIVPREWWRSKTFSEALANFSLPMVWLTDAVMGVETHAMRVEVTAKDGRRCVAVQSHESFRRCVAQSAAEFLLTLMEMRAAGNDKWRPGVYLPEELAEEAALRQRLIERLTQTPGTISYRVLEL